MELLVHSKFSLNDRDLQYSIFTIGSSSPENDPPIIAASASPTELLIGEDVSFGANASDPDGDLLIYSWDFGDGTESLEQNPIHTYSAPGKYTARITVSDGKGGSSFDNIEILVVDGSDEDDDKGDDKDDDKDEKDPDQDKPQNQFRLNKLKIHLNFKKEKKDHIHAGGTIHLDEGFDPKGAEFTLNIAGIERTFVLDKKLRARKAKEKEGRKDQFSVKPKYEKVEVIKEKSGSKIIRKGKPKKIKVFVAGDAKWKAKFQKADFKEVFQSFGLLNEDIKKKMVNVPVTLTYEGQEYSETITVKYKAKLDSIGKASGKKR